MNSRNSVKMSFNNVFDALKSHLLSKFMQLSGSLSGGLNTALIIVLRGIYPRTDGIGDQLAGGRRVEIAHEFGLVRDSCIQPQVIMGRGDEGRHALMQ